MASKYGKVDVAELLLERGANPNAAGKVRQSLKYTHTQYSPFYTPVKSLKCDQIAAFLDVYIITVCVSYIHVFACVSIYVYMCVFNRTV